MPKAKPTQVIVHRIELQESERTTLDLALAGKFATNGISAVGSVLAGVGTMLAPFSGALTALAALWIADRTIEEVIESVKDHAQKTREQAGTWITEKSGMIGYYELISAWLNMMMGRGGWPMIFQEFSGFVQMMQAQKVPQFLIDRFTQIIQTMSDLDQGQTAGGNIEDHSPDEWWTLFYPMDEYENEILHHLQKGVKAGNPLFNLVW